MLISDEVENFCKYMKNKVTSQTHLEFLLKIILTESLEKLKNHSIDDYINITERMKPLKKEVTDE